MKTGPSTADEHGYADILHWDALKEQLGLELRSTQGDDDVLIIERIERPTPN